MPWVGIDANEGCHLDVVPGLFPYLSDRCVAYELSNIVSATWKRPQPVIGALDDEYFASVVRDCGDDRGDDCVCAWCLWVVDVIGPAHTIEGRSS